MKLTYSALALSLFAFTVASSQAQQWVAPTPEELKMTSIPEVPGASAVILYKEQSTDDGRHESSYYMRIKVLTEGGKEYANVELPYVAGVSGQAIANIAGRTIQPDGRIIPFTGKPYQKILEKNHEFKVKETVFTLPEVEVGSIIEYRYQVNLDDNYYSSPEWIVQSDLFLRKGHFSWLPTSQSLMSEDGKTTSVIAWHPILPPGVEVKRSQPNRTLGQSAYEGNNLLTLDVTNIAPLPREQYMLPMKSVSYQVQFYYSPALSVEEYWKQEGKTWSRARDKFIGPNATIKTAVDQLVSASDTPDQKLRKIYAAVMQVENTNYTRQRTDEEQRAEGVKKLTSTADVWTLKRGNDDQIALLFVAMARAAGLKAYVMGVANRDERLFVAGYRTTRQLDDDIAIVNVDGKDLYFDPGQRYERFGHLAWKHTGANGLRQTETGTALVMTPMEPYKESHTSRVADLKLDDEGKASGVVTMEFTGDPALSWRHTALRDDETELKSSLEHSLQETLPGGMDVHMLAVQNLTDPELPLKVSFKVEGPVGTATGKRLLVPADLFQSTAKPLFPESTRELAVDMHFGHMAQDAIRYQLPASLVIESAPADAEQRLQLAIHIPGAEATEAKKQAIALYQLTSKRAANSITFYRNLSLGNVFFAPKEYPDLRSFYGKLEASDQEVVVLTRPAASSASAGSGSN